MPPYVVDLTQDTPSPPRMSSSKSKNRSTPLPAGQANLPTLNDVRVPGTQKEALVPISKAMASAIDTMDITLVRAYLKAVCEKYPPIRHVIQEKYMVQGKDVVRYHRDSDSEDDPDDSDQESDFESLEGEVDSDDESGFEYRTRKVYPIATAEEENTPRFAICERCNIKFDVTENTRDCYWHEGKIFYLWWEREGL